MAFEKNIFEFIVNQFCRRVIITLDFIADYLHFLVNLLLGVLAVEHDVGEQIHGLLEVFFGDGCIVDGVLLVGEGVQFTAHAFQGIDDLQGIAALCPLEGHVLAEVGDTFFAWVLVTGAGCYLIAAVDHLRR